MKKILKKSVKEAVKKNTNFVPPPYDSSRSQRRNPIEQWKDNPTSLRKSINAKCYECCGGENSSNRTRYCNIFNCPLWNVRPFSKKITKEMCENWEDTL